MTDRKLWGWKYKPAKDKNHFFEKKKALKGLKIIFCLGISSAVIFFPTFAFCYQGIWIILVPAIFTTSLLFFTIILWKVIKECEKLLTEDKRRLRIIL